MITLGWTNAARRQHPGVQHRRLRGRPRAVAALWAVMRPSDGPEATLLKLARDRDLFLVARDGDGCIVGTVVGGWDGRRAYVYHLAVTPERRREGIANALMDELEERFRAGGRSKSSCRSSWRTRLPRRSSPVAVAYGRRTVNREARSWWRAAPRPAGDESPASPFRGRGTQGRRRADPIRTTRAAGPGWASRPRRGVGRRSQPRGCCWVMQCTLPPPSTISRPGTVTTSRSGNAPAMISRATASLGSSNVGMTTPPLTMRKLR